MNWGTVLPILIPAAAAVIAPFFAYRQAIKTGRQGIEAGAYGRAITQYESALTENEKRITRMLNELKQERAEREEAERDCRQELAALRRDLNALREWSRPLLQKARAAGISYSEPPVWLGAEDSGPQGRVE